MALQKGDRILVTGGAGYVGSHTCKALARQGFEPVVYDDLSTGHHDFVRWGPLVVGDIRDTERMRAAIADYDVRHVVHFAAESLVAKSNTHPELFYSVNVGGTLALVTAMRDAGCSSLVLSSSCAVFGAPAKTPISESEVHAPLSVYGRSKAMVESMLEDFRLSSKMKITALRYFNAAGADPDGEIGERHDPETHIIPRAIAAALGILAQLELFGSDYPTRDGTAIRDYVHVCDLADAHIAALELHGNGGRGASYNLGAGRGYSVKEIIGAVAEVIGCDVPVRFVERRSGDPPELVADATLAADQLNFRPYRSDLKSIVDTAVAWHRKDGIAV